jgi:hypothetical protein
MGKFLVTVTIVMRQIMIAVTYSHHLVRLEMVASFVLVKFKRKIVI